MTYYQRCKRYAKNIGEFECVSPDPREPGVPWTACAKLWWSCMKPWYGSGRTRELACEALWTALNGAAIIYDEGE